MVMVVMPVQVNVGMCVENCLMNMDMFMLFIQQE